MAGALGDQSDRNSVCREGLVMLQVQPIDVLVTHPAVRLRPVRRGLTPLVKVEEQP